MTEKTLTTENIKPAIDALRGELAPWPVVAMKQDKLNDTQKSAVNSGITSGLVAQIIANTAAIRALESAITGTGLRPLVVASLPAIGTQGILYIVPVTTYDPATDADVVNYSNEYIWIVAPDAPVTEGYYEQVGQTGIVINNGQLTITVNGTSVGTFTANQAGDTTAAITVPTNADYVDRTTAQSAAGVKTFSDGIVSNVTGNVTGDLTGTASRAIADEDGTNIKTGYGKLAGANTWTDTNTFRNINPETNSTYSLGSSSYQWLDTCTQNLFLNGEKYTSIPLGNAGDDLNNCFLTAIGIAKYYAKTFALANNVANLPNAGIPFAMKSETVRYISNSDKIIHQRIIQNGIEYTRVCSGTAWSSWVSQYALKTGSASTGGTVTNTYFKIASFEVGVNTYFGAILQVQDLCYTQKQAVITINIRTNVDGTFQAGRLYLHNSSEIFPENFILCYKEDTDKVLCELYYYQTSTWDGIRFSVLSETMLRSTLFDIMTVYNAVQSDAVASLPAGYTTIQTTFMPLSEDLIPTGNNFYTLGSSNKQWNKVYSKEYYYNGTQWGLDRDNTWTGVNTFSTATAESIAVKHTTYKGAILFRTNGVSNFKNYNTFLKWDINNYDNTLGLYRSVGVLGDTTTGATDEDIDTSFSLWKAHIRSKSLEFTNSVRVTNDGTENSLKPITTSVTDLGTSTNQWKSVYSQTYYYNGTAWGLDKSNTWSGNNEYKYLIGLSGAEIWFKQQNIEDITANPDTNISKSIIQIYNKAVTQYSGGITDSLLTDGTHRISISCFGFPLNNYGGYYPHSFSFEAKRDGTASFSPTYTNASLGTSSNKWKTLNGINPGALSFPARDYVSSMDIDTTAWDLTGTTFYYTPLIDGWLQISVSPNNNYAYIAVEYATLRSNSENTTGRNAMLTVPVVANKSYDITIIGSAIAQARLASAQGNV